MKAQMKAIMASAVVIALCLAAVGGVTYSWFSDSEDSQIDITAGTIDVKATWGAMTLSSYGYSETTTVNGDGYYNFPFNSSKVTVSTDDHITGVITKTFDMQNIVPGDSLSFNITNVSLTTNVNVVFSYGYSIEVISGPSIHPFTFDITPAFPATTSVDGDGSTHNYDDVSVKVSMKTESGNEYQGCKYRIQFFVKAVQGNMPSTTVAAVNTTGANNINLQSSTSASTTASLQFSGSDAAPLTSQNLTVSMIPNTASGYTTTDTDDIVLGGISVTTDAEVTSALAGTPTRITLTIPGVYNSTNINVYHGNTAVITPDHTASGISEVSITPNSTDTTISFITELGFSNYYITGNFDAYCDGLYYETIDSAIASIDNNGKIILMKNIDTTDNVIVPIGKNITINMNNKILNLYPGKEVAVEGSLDLIGTGVIKSTNSYDAIALISSTDCNNRNHLNIGEGITIDTTNTTASVWIGTADFAYTYNASNTMIGYSDTTLSGTFNKGIVTFGNIKNTDSQSTLTIKNANVYGQNYFPGNLTYTISDSQFTAKETVFIFKGGNVSIQDCTIIMQELPTFTPAFISSSSGAFSAKAAVYIEDKSGYAMVSEGAFSNNNIQTPTGVYGEIVYFKLTGEANGTIEIYDSSGALTEVDMSNEYKAWRTASVKNYGTCTLFFKT